MNRRDFLKAVPFAAALPALPFQQEKSKLKITGIRLVSVKPKRTYPAFKPAAGAWSTQYVEVANPMSIYPEYKAQRPAMPLHATRIRFSSGARGAAAMPMRLNSSTSSTPAAATTKPMACRPPE